MLGNPHCLLQPIPGKAGKDIPEHLIPFGQEACLDWALKWKVTERPAHGDTVQSPSCPGCAHLVWSELAPPWGVLPTWCKAGAGTPLMWCCSGLSESMQEFDLYNNMASTLILALLCLGG